MTVASPPNPPRARERRAPVAFPSIGLGEALERTRALYEQAHRRRHSREEIARLLGYGGLNGASVPMISNLARYGLIEGRGEAIQVSDDAQAVLIEPEGSAEHIAALRRLALKPELFSELAREFEGAPLPAENTVRIRLERRGFSPAAARAASRAFRETMELVQGKVSAYNEPAVADQMDDQGGRSVPSQAVAQPTAHAPSMSLRSGTISAHSPVPPKDADGFLWLRVPFQGATLTVRVEVSGQPLKKEHVARVRKYLELAEDDLESGTGVPAAAKGEGGGA